MAYAFASVGVIYELDITWCCILCIILLLASILLWKCRRLLQSTAVIALGVCVAELHQTSPWQTYLRLLPRQECSVEIMAKVMEEPEVRGEWMTVPLGLERMRTSSGWREARGRVLGCFAKDDSVDYGDILRIEGALLKFDEEDFTSRYRLIQGIRRRCVIGSFERLGHRPFWAKSFIYRLRRWMAESLAADFKDAENSGLYQAMIVGLRSRMPIESREIFVRSASVHLFSISGLHILFFSTFLDGVMAAFAVPRRHRMALLLPAMLVYVCVSGSAPSALRSYYMMLAATFAFYRKRQHSLENGLALSGLVLLLFNPLYIKHLGFLFSFTLVFCLLKGRLIFKAWTAVMFEKDGLMPNSRWNVSLRMCRKGVLSLLFGSVVAWLGSAGIMMRSSCLISFGSIMVNLALAPLASVLVFLAVPKMIASVISVAISSFLANCIEFLLQILTLMSKAGGSGMLCNGCAQVGVPTLAVYYGLLVIVLSGIRPIWTRFLSLAMLMAIIIQVAVYNDNAGLLLVSASIDGAPPCVALIGGRQSTMILQTGDRHAMRRMMNALRRLGCAEHLHLRLSSREELHATMSISTTIMDEILLGGNGRSDSLAGNGFISKAIGNGVHLVPKGNLELNGMDVAHGRGEIGVRLPNGTLSIRNHEKGMTEIILPEGGFHKFQKSCGESGFFMVKLEQWRSPGWIP